MIRSIAEPLVDWIFIHSFFKEERWQLKRKIGKGSFGTAYLIYDFSENRFYILKRMNYHKLRSGEARSSFTIETQLLDELQDGAFPALIDQGNWRGLPYIIMEYKAGKTFEELIFSEGKVFTEQESFLIVSRLLTKIIELHQRGIIHRDLRIPNVLTDGECLSIIDFGLARKVEKTSSEKEEENPRKPVHFSSDLYSLGHFLLFLLYSSYQATIKKERPWDEELTLLPESKRIIKKLLMSDVPFQSSSEALSEIKKHIEKQWE
ncbi:serine/threonine protein kinase [Peribacillus cavernae]|uniref:serine/threonine protein kinase n=1 Tax=Peribacillus cavernae TaxID=1674310 RepID=UPI00163C822A|nr:protein kinase [Peribacillus cavernae]MDQ0217945.1 serine/threonine-protein kinase [Peribacillus cavernae]